MRSFRVAVCASFVVFNANPGRIGFEANRVSEQSMSETSHLSGNPTPFTATKQPPAAE